MAERRVGSRVRVAREEVDALLDRTDDRDGPGDGSDGTDPAAAQVPLVEKKRTIFKLVPEAGNFDGEDPQEPAIAKVYRGYSHIGSLYLGTLQADDDENSLKELGGGGPYTIAVCNADGQFIKRGIRRINLPGDMKPGSYLQHMMGMQGAGIPPSVANAGGVPVGMAGPSIYLPPADNANSPQNVIEFAKNQVQAAVDSAKQQIEMTQNFMKTQIESMQMASKTQMEAIAAANERASVAERAANERASASEKNFIEAMMGHQKAIITELTTKLNNGGAGGAQDPQTMLKQTMGLVESTMSMVGSLAGKMGGGNNEPGWVTGLRVGGEVVKPIVEKVTDALAGRRAAQTTQVRAARIVRRTPAPAAAAEAPAPSPAAPKPRRRFAPSEPDDAAPEAETIRPTIVPNPGEAPVAEQTVEEEARDESDSVMDRIDAHLMNEAVTPEQIAGDVLAMAQAGQVQPFILDKLLTAKPAVLMLYCRRFGRGHWTEEPLRSRLLASLDILRGAVRDAKLAEVTR